MGSGSSAKRPKNSPPQETHLPHEMSPNKQVNAHSLQAENPKSPIKEEAPQIIPPTQAPEQQVPPPKKINKKELWEIVDKNNSKDLELLFHQESFTKDELYNSQGQSIFHYAAQIGNAECISVLIENLGTYDMSPNLVNSNLATPLHLACLNNREEAARVLLQSGVNANLEDEHGQTPLFLCCIHGNIKVLEKLLDASNSGSLPELLDANKPDKKELTPLNCCTIKNDIASAKLLIDKGNANINCQGSKGCTPLIYASRGGNVEILSLLISHKADLNLQDCAGSTALHHAIEKDKAACITALLDAGADVNVPDYGGRTAIFEAIDVNNVETIKILIKYGARLNETDYYGHTPLFNSSRDGKLELVKLLIENNADPNYFSIEHPKIKKERKECKKEESTKQDEIFKQGVERAMLPIQIAAAYNHVEVLRFLLEKGAKPNEGGMKQNTALHIAALCKRKDSILLLLEYGADPNRENEKGKNTFQLVEIYFAEFSKEFQDSYHPVESLPSRPGTTSDVKKPFTPFDDRDFVDMNPEAKQKISHMMNEDIKRKEALLIQEEAPLDQSDSVFDISQSQINVPNTEFHYQLIANTFKPQIAKALMEQSEVSKRSKALKWILKNYKLAQANKTDAIIAATYGLYYCADSKVRKVSISFINLLEDILNNEQLKDSETSGLFLKAVFETGLNNKIVEKGCSSTGKDKDRIILICMMICDHPNLTYKAVAEPLFQILSSLQAQIDSKVRVGIRFCLELIEKLVTKVGIQPDDPLSLPYITNIISPLLKSKWKEISEAACQIQALLAQDKALPSEEGSPPKDSKEEFMDDPDILSKLQSKEKTSDEVTIWEIVSLIKNTKEPPYKEFFSNCGPYLLVKL